MRLSISQERPDGTHQAAAVLGLNGGFGQNDVGFEFCATSSAITLNDPLAWVLSQAIGAPVQESVLVSFARHGRSQVQSFPRKRESTPQAAENAPWEWHEHPAREKSWPRWPCHKDWIPAFAGMTGVSKEIQFKMTPAPRNQNA